MVHQTDYGTPNDKTLVPGSLRVFRHFGVDARMGIITPMNYAPVTSHGGMYVRDSNPPVYRPGPTTHEARCTKSRMNIWFDEFTPPPRHPAPDVSCTCGFYAHYKQGTDFYPNVLWGAEYNRDLGRHDMADMIVLRAVCEVSGTTVMGRLGVRAQKMEIKAIAVDWSKFRDPRRRIDPPDLLDFVQPGRTSYRDAFWEMRIKRDDEPDELERRRVHEIVEYLAYRYGVRFYEDWKEMYRDHPEADVSALGVEDAPTERGKPTAPPTRPWAALRADIQRQSAAYAKAAEAAKDLQRVMREILGLDPVTGLPLDLNRQAKPKAKKKPKPGGSMPEHVQAALDAKQSRKAPPGSGIDRRRGKLR